MSCSRALGARAEYGMPATDSHVQLLVEVAETLGNGAELKEASPWEYKFEERIALVPLSLALFVATMM